MFWWIIWTFIFLILLGNDNHLLGSTWSGRSDYFFGGSGKINRPRQTDFEIRREMRQHNVPEIVRVNADDQIDNPDLQLEKLIQAGYLDEARDYRIEMERIAEEMDDDASLRKYAIYGARISKKQKELDRKKSRERYDPDMEPPVASGKKSPATRVETIEASETIGRTPPPVGGRGIPPPLWGSRSKTRPVTSDKEKPALISQPEVEPDVIVSTDKPRPKSLDPLAGQPVPPDRYTPPPPGPVQLGADSRYKPGPIKTDRSEIPELDKKDEEIDPDDYTDLISI